MCGSSAVVRLVVRTNYSNRLRSRTENNWHKFSLY